MKVIIVFLSVLCSGQLLWADIHVKQVLHEDEYYDAYITPASDTDVEYWFGENRMAILKNEWKGILDLEQNSIVFINHNDSSYFDVKLPLDREKLISEQARQRIDAYIAEGLVSGSNEEKKINNLKCENYVWEEWLLREGNRGFDRDLDVWFSTDVPFNWELFKKMESVIKKLLKHSDQYLSELEKMSGFLLEADIIRYNRGNKIHSSIKTVSITEQKTNPKIYSIPEGYKKKEGCTFQELIGILGLTI